MTYPQTWADLQTFRQAWTPPASVAADFEQIRNTAIPYTFCVRAFDMLAPIAADLDNDGLAIALGAAHQINVVQFDGRTAEGLAFIDANLGRYTPPTPPGLPPMGLPGA